MQVQVLGLEQDLLHGVEHAHKLHTVVFQDDSGRSAACNSTDQEGDGCDERD